MVATDPLLSQVLDVITSLAAGQLGTRVAVEDVERDDDLAAIAVGINMLAEELQALAGGLELAVAERTRELRQTQEQLSYDASHDHLTGLANRRLMHQRLEHQLVREHHDTALLLLDLDGFKEINDSAGHGIGDGVLVEVADRLRRCLRPTDTIARLGGDEFAALLLGIGDRGLEVVAERIRSALQEPMTVEGLPLRVTSSLGLVPLPAAATAEELFRLADLAMYDAKSHGKNRAQVYTEQIELQAQQKRDIEGGLRAALKDGGGLRVVYQPLVDARSRQLVGVEALARWPYGEGPAFGPDAFIPVAEQSGLIQELGAGVLRQVCRDAVAWAQRAGTVLRFSVNVSGEQLAQPGFADLVQRTLADTGALPAMLLLEVTESVLMEHEQGLAALAMLRQTGVEIAIDDFGTGYSSLAALRRLPVDTLKIDRSFISGIGTDDDDGTVVRAILGLARGLHLSVVAEGVETGRQHQELVRLGCDVLQGYLFARPMPVDELAPWAAAQEGARR